tara:strand:+ start:778 stop:1212 length:435 start_codon:yes stop_codon:yes gene_type:complete
MIKFYKIHKVKLKHLSSKFDIDSKGYDWEKLKTSLKKEGLASEKYGYIKGRKSFFHKDRYILMDGNHRAEVLKSYNNEEDEIDILLVSRKIMIFMYVILFFAIILHLIIRVLSLGKIMILKPDNRGYRTRTQNPIEFKTKNKKI